MCSLKKLYSLAGGLLLIPALGFAEDVNNEVTDINISYYLGVEAGYQVSSDDDYPYSDPHSAVGGIYGGINLTDQLSWDLGYQYLGEMTGAYNSINIETSIVRTGLRYTYPIYQQLSVYGYAGAAYWSMDKSSIRNSISDDGFSPIYKLGVTAPVTESLVLDIGYQYIDGIGSQNTGEFDSHGAMIGLTYHFGRAKAPQVAVPTVIESHKEECEPQIVEPRTIYHYSAQLSKEMKTFGVDKAELSLQQKEIEHITQLLIDNPTAKVKVIGHSDSSGSEAYNQKLSEKRAKYIADKLKNNGVEEERIIANGKGEMAPIASNETIEGRALNRRVDITVFVSE
ncbi:outer membrane protein A [Vibrio zhanjiangensis]|uniref:Outer membrane protein A n=1 Tax=Vibrio zhanjiangensis TaxID=1046128 RepID=A0ABQ6EYU3_9VIBR|nr:OmpA family protein [Vibrio zhanjiangensis]GLT18383.1 outer membrane protein A [Vibrio zhanjiangensis]